jgi:hypothetical protein
MFRVQIAVSTINMTETSNDALSQSLENFSSFDITPYHRVPKSSLLRLAESKVRGSSTRLIFAAFVFATKLAVFAKKITCVAFLYCAIPCPTLNTKNPVYK